MDPKADPTATQLRNRNIVVEQMIYHASTCAVYKAFDQTLNIPIALKLMLYPVSGDAEIAAREIANQQICVHPNIVQLYDYFWYYLQDRNPTHWIGVLKIELLENDVFRDIQARKKENFPYTEEVLFEFIGVMTSALAAAQELNICHRDVKPHNVFLSKGVFKIGDFGSSKQQLGDIAMMTLTGTPCYLSPVLRQGLKYRQRCLAHNPYKSDMFSLGLTALHMAMLVPLSPFGMDIGAMTATALQCISYSDSLKALLSWMLRYEETDRPDFLYLWKYLNGESVQKVSEIACCEHLQNNAESIQAPCGHSLCQQCLPMSQKNFQQSIIVQCRICTQTFEYFFEQAPIMVPQTQHYSPNPDPIEQEKSICVACQTPKPKQQGISMEEAQIRGWYCYQCIPGVLNTGDGKKHQECLFNVLSASLRLH